MNAHDLMTKASQAARSARLLIDAADADGASNRAYYAMFDAARASLLVADCELGKTHKGTLNAFSEHLVKTGKLPKEMGRQLKQAEVTRCIADYAGDPLELADAQMLVAIAERFVADIQAAFFSDG